MVENGFDELYVNTAVDDGSKIAELMQYIKNTQGEQNNFPRISKRVKYFKEEQKVVETMCELVEQYAQVTAKEAEQRARMFLLNGAIYEMA